MFPAIRPWPMTGPRIPSQNDSSVQDADAAYCQALISTITSSKVIGLTHLSHVSVRFGDFDTVTPADAHVSTNHKILSLAQQILQFSWAVYSFDGGHFVSTISSHNLPFCLKIACNQYESSRALFLTPPPCSGNSKEPSLPSCAHCVIFRWSLQLSFLTMTADASHLLLSLSNPKVGE
jgi:hypothetical protein